MKLTSLKALTVGTLAAAIVAFGASVALATGSLTSVTATSTGSIANSGVTTAPIAIQATTTTNIASGGVIYITYPSGWSIPGSSGACGARITLTGLSASSCVMDSTKAQITIGAIPASTTFTATFATGSLNASSNRDFVLETYVSGAPPVLQDSGTATLAAAAPSPSGSSTSTSSASSTSSTSGLAATGSDNTGAIVLGAGFLMAGLVALAGVQALRRRKNV